MSGGGSNTVNPPSAYFPESGMTEEHFQKFREAAMEEGVMAVVRHTQRASTELIRQKCPGKPLSIKFNTNDVTGVVTAKTAEEVEFARREGYLVVDDDHVARGFAMEGGKRVPRELRLRGAFWTVQPKQLIDAKLEKPLVGDYDLMGVIDPANPGQNITLATRNGQAVVDRMSPIAKSFSERVNDKMDMARVHHGAQDQYAGFRGGATIFLPDGRVHLLRDQAEVALFYEVIGRQTILGRYGSTPFDSLTPQQSQGIRLISGRGLVQRLKSAGANVAVNQAAIELMGQALGMAIQWFGDMMTKRRVQNELATTHAAAIRDSLLQGDGVLVIVRMQEWCLPDFNGMRARGLLGVYVEPGATQQEAMDNWQKPKWIKGPPLGWRAYEQYAWIDPNY